MQDKAAAFKATELDSELERELDTKATALFERVAQCNAEIRTSDEESREIASMPCRFQNMVCLIINVCALCF